MFGKKLVEEMITRSSENRHDRRRFLTSAGALGLGVIGAKVLMAAPASAAEPSRSAPAAVPRGLGRTTSRACASRRSRSGACSTG